MKKKKAPASKAVKKKSSARIKDLKPRKNPKGGISLITPAVQAGNYQVQVSKISSPTAP